MIREGLPLWPDKNRAKYSRDHLRYPSDLTDDEWAHVDQRGNVRANMSDYQTSLPKVFSAGDMRRGQSLVVWAIREGRLCARAIDAFLMGSTTLPR
jgi:NADPH-dependent glutamate synthase beta subunit-like oxidoreductase